MFLSLFGLAAIGLSLIGLGLVLYLSVCHYPVCSARPDISLLLVVCNQDQGIEGLVRKLFSCSLICPPFELVIVDDHSRDETPEILLRLQRKYHFSFVKAAHQRSVEAGLALCRGRIIYCLELTGELSLKNLAFQILPLLKGQIPPERLNPPARMIKQEPATG